MSEVLQAERETVKEPAKRWRNWWAVLPQNAGCNALCSTCKSFMFLEHLGAGDPFPDCCPVFPSEDSARTAALEWAALKSLEGVADPFHRPSEYLGAFPEGEHP